MDLLLRCRCGAFQATVHDVDTRPALHAVCYCDDCQAFARALQRPEVLLPGGGTDILQIRPNALTIDVGHEHLRCLRLSEKGLLRWHTGCCSTPVFNTLAASSVPFVGVLLTNAVDVERVPLPPPVRILGRFARGEPTAPVHPKLPASLMLQTARFLAGGALKRASRPTPLFTATGEPVVTPRVLSAAEAAAARA
jgi:hypothetical protein